MKKTFAISAISLFNLCQAGEYVIPEPISIEPQTFVLYENNWVYRPPDVEICEAAKLNGKFIRTTQRFTTVVPEDEEFKNAFEAMTKGNWVITALVSVAGLLFCNMIAENKKEKEFAEL